MFQSNKEQVPHVSDAGPSDLRSKSQTAMATDLVETAAEPELLVRTGATSGVGPSVSSDTALNPPQAAGHTSAGNSGPSNTS